MQNIYACCIVIPDDILHSCTYSSVIIIVILIMDTLHTAAKQKAYTFRHMNTCNFPHVVFYMVKVLSGAVGF